MKRIFRDYLTFNRIERNGVFILFAIIVLFLIYLNISEYFLPNDNVDFSKFEKEIAALNLSVEKTKDSITEYRTHKYTSNKTYKPIVNAPVERFDFNPNNLPDKDWKRLGFTEKQISMIKHYESKGGKFRIKEDVKKMYCIKEEQYISLEPYINIPEEEKKKFVKDSAVTAFVKTENKNPKPEIIPVEINSADSFQLITIKGIKGFYAKEIIKYRQLLGGFVSKAQLFELYKFDTVKYNLAEKYILIDASFIKKININTCTDKELKHPYLSWNIVNAVINYRKKHGMFKTIDDIKKTGVVDEETYRKIAPYLIVEIEK